MRYYRSGVRHPSCAPFRQLERTSEYIGYIPTQRRTQRLDLMIPRFRENEPARSVYQGRLRTFISYDQLLLDPFLDI